jgi:glycosyltransferase involved in cell wall biosynthesis
MRIAVFHYHLKPGGVTEVIVHSVRNILSRMHELSEIRLVSGDSENTGNVMERIREGFDRQTADKLRLDVLEEISYNRSVQSSNPGPLAERLEARYPEETLWWIHNYHLGKNPVFTAALMKVAAGGRRDMLLHIHDFPECGRIENLGRLDAALTVPPYPSGPRIRYAVINERDRRILADAGLEDSVHLLLNPVPMDPLEDVDIEAVKKALEKRSGGDGFMPDAPILLYPVRAIRRKNILEAMLITRLLEEPANLIVTLPGVSQQEKRYSDIVRSAYLNGLAAGSWCPEASGDPALSYSSLTAACDAVISTSVQEGFGYLFLNALHWRKPLLGRYLDVLDGVLDLFGDYPRRFWADLRIPSDPELIRRTREAYQAKIRNAASVIPAKSLKSISAAAAKLASGGAIDMSYLSVEDQLVVLNWAKDNPLWLEETRLLNRELLDSFGRTLKARAPSMDRQIETHFGEAPYIRRFSEVISSFGSKTHAPSPAKVRDSVRKSFGRIDYMRLLYDE